ncbi:MULTISPECIES: CPBP family intramembrane glutamic endopeptidase [Clostridium]|jgi:uncharacterized protein|uniref:CAAX amino terminal protease self-immunity n=1 Tax=Clostridium thermopalmarium DSM 5974 TaxID=1121340 RepID=A0A2T0AR55_9CLOT|nr:type II CAAX endopeptidase family protein [Clostridium thermopalmarium]MBE6043887.1 CPBP family intramembrane metalloprotease [Clostridium thermopalmarium]PRR72032.1 CAAX amino terminal protease self- immunity [Clostridium thermopalmarium DSM 5974]PVZ23684.1 hypothetical protein LX19_01391 [Clostridium thermopalmarium DSM 5974]
MENKSVFQANLFAFILLLLYAIAPMALIPIFRRMNISSELYIVLPQILLLLIPTIIYFIITKKPIKDTLKLKKIGIKSIGIIIAVGIFAQPIAMFLSFITQFVFPNRISQVVSSLDDIPLIVRLCIIALIPAICEEITMRGVVLAGYENINIRKAALMTGTFFGILHLDGNQLLYAFVLGIIFAYLVRITGSIYSSMICHFTINGTQVLLSELATKMMRLGGESVELAQNTGISSMSKAQLINTFFSMLILGIICLGIIIILIGKLTKIYGKDGLEERETSVKVMNWPVYGALIVYAVVILVELVGT